MGVSKQQTVENRKAIIGTAARLFREHGVEAVGLNELMAGAGFTRGGFYNHFKCKDDLVAAVMMAAVEAGMARLDTAIDAARNAGQCPHRGVIGWFLSGDHRRDLSEGCPLATFVGDVPRLDDAVRRTYAYGLEANLRRYTDIAATPGADPAECRRRALTVYSHMIGALLLSRAVAHTDTTLADEILDASRDHLLESAA
jgi:TetR/AcrR family transcriptional regulator, transcriptional repressor for nem operon